MMRVPSLSLVLLLFISPSILHGQFSDDFESYGLGGIPTDSLWVDFGGTLEPEISSDQASSGTQSLKLATNPVDPNPAGLAGYGADVFTDLEPPIDSGVWELSFKQFTPADFNGVNFSNLSQQEIGANNFEFGAQLVVDASPEFNLFVYQNQEEFATLPLIRDQWVTVSAKIDLENDLVDISYGGEPLYTGAWDLDGDDMSPATFGGINLWAQFGSGGAIYFDDFSLAPQSETEMACDFTGSGTCNVRDLDLLLDALGTENEQFILTEGDLVSLADRDEWLVQASDEDPDAIFVLGDANFDGVVDAIDLNGLGQAWFSTDDPGWADGDFDGNDVVDPADLNVMGRNWLHGVAPAAAAVPEPAVLWIALVCVFFVGRRRIG